MIQNGLVAQLALDGVIVDGAGARRENALQRSSLNPHRILSIDLALSQGNRPHNQRTLVQRLIQSLTHHQLVALHSLLAHIVLRPLVGQSQSLSNGVKEETVVFTDNSTLAGDHTSRRTVEIVAQEG